MNWRRNSTHHLMSHQQCSITHFTIFFHHAKCLATQSQHHFKLHLTVLQYCWNYFHDNHSHNDAESTSTLYAVIQNWVWWSSWDWSVDCETVTRISQHFMTQTMHKIICLTNFSALPQKSSLTSWSALNFHFRRSWSTLSQSWMSAFMSFIIELMAFLLCRRWKI